MMIFGDQYGHAPSVRLCVAAAFGLLAIGHHLEGWQILLAADCSAAFRGPGALNALLLRIRDRRSSLHPLHVGGDRLPGAAAQVEARSEKHRTHDERCDHGPIVTDASSRSPSAGNRVGGQYLGLHDDQWCGIGGGGAVVLGLFGNAPFPVVLP